MSHHLLSRVVALLAIPLFLVAVSVVQVQAVALTGTTTTLTVTGGNKPGDLLTLEATVTSASGVPTGSVHFTGNALDVVIPLGADGTALAQTPAATATERISAEFTSESGFAYSLDSERGDVMSRIVWEPEPTIARLAPPRLKLTTAARLRDRAGRPMVGVTVDFSLGNPFPAFPEPGGPAFRVCTAVSDQTGLASCKGSGALGAVLSLLLGGAYATEKQGFFNTDQWAKLPVLRR
ncbi:Ig-like domain-containing protein [Nocardioides carbamazepini]|uniref:Ig-like domain-containing protein n=1 Tax=Nocardioides carbamazepini TaxID=2854259 RepID=UPI00214A29D2|nr:Ig-like domain-containing protein [Nocardioides carbamazepini]MCR1784522.1 Ig-like domain-containing protein [Nocardioides carbamazepini]